MKIASLQFSHPAAARAYKHALRERMYAAGYEPPQVTEWFRAWFPPKKLTAYIAGTADAERAIDVASEVRGVTYDLVDAP